MPHLLPVLVLFLQNTVFVSSTPAAALLGPGYPPSTDLTSNCSLVSAAWSDFGAAIKTYIDRNQTLQGLAPNLGSYTFSVIGMVALRAFHCLGFLRLSCVSKDGNFRIGSAFRIKLKRLARPH